MIHSSYIQPQPQPVLPSKVDIEVKYVVVRGDGLVKVFNSLYGGAESGWQALASVPNIATFVLVPLDMLTACKLGIVIPQELALPEHLLALINMIKP
jgi:hypothetical protein